MTIARRHMLGFFAASAAAALAGCGGGGDGPPTRTVGVLNVNPDFASAEVKFNNAAVASVDFPRLSPPLYVPFGTYTVALRDVTGPRGSLLFDNISVDANSPSVEVFYRRLNSARLGVPNALLLESTPPIILNCCDLDNFLTVEFDYGSGIVVPKSVPFEGSSDQPSQFPRESIYRLRVRRSDGTLDFDSGTQTFHSNTHAIVLFPFNSTGNRVGVLGLNYGGGNASVEEWNSVI